MIEIKTNSDTCILVLHEIYGINQFMKDMCESLSEQNVDVVCPNLLAQETAFDYNQEELAYESFMARAGFKNSVHKVKELVGDIRDQYSKIFILGFSVGATIAWLCSEEKCVDGIVGYYGSRIRNYTQINPACPTLLYFSKVEKSFDVHEMVLKLKKPNVDIHVYDGQHGFSDPYAFGYNEELARKTFSHSVKFFSDNRLKGSTS